MIWDIVFSIKNNLLRILINFYVIRIINEKQFKKQNAKLIYLGECKKINTLSAFHSDLNLNESNSTAYEF